MRVSKLVRCWVNQGNLKEGFRREEGKAVWVVAVVLTLLVSVGVAVILKSRADEMRRREQQAIVDEAHRAQERKRSELEAIERKLLARNIPALTRTDVVWRAFREALPYHTQTVALSPVSSDGSRTLIISEPPPHVSLGKILSSIGEPVLNHSVKQYAIGHDGWVKDVVVAVSGEEQEIRSRLSALNQLLFFTSYKAYVTPLPVNVTPPNEVNLELEVTAADLKQWVIDESELFEPILGGPSLSLKELFARSVAEVCFSHTPGLVAWWIPKQISVANCRVQARQFTMDSDLIVGAISNTAGALLIGRRRIVPVETLPPLRVETLVLLNAVQTGEAGELKQSYERNHPFAGRIDSKRDWAPILLSPELVDTEYGSLLNITDQLLKGWSNNGDTHYVNFKYPQPDHWPFNPPLFERLSAGQLTYNWNTKGAGYTVNVGDYRIMALNRTGALPVSYFPDGQEGGAAEAEDIAYEYFARLSDPNLVRVVQYAAIYQIFSAFDVAKPTEQVNKNSFPDSALQSLTEELLAELRTASTTELSALAHQAQPVVWGALSGGMNFYVERLINQEARERGVEVSGNERTTMAQYLLSRFAQSLAEDIEDEFRKLAEGTDPDDERDPIRILSMSALAGLKKLPQRYSDSVAARATGWIHTPVVVVSWNEGKMLDGIGGHNLDAKVTKFRLSETVKEGVTTIDSDGYIIVNPKDTGRISRLVRAAGRNDSASVDDLSSKISSVLKRSENALPRSRETALGMTPPPRKLPESFAASVSDAAEPHRNLGSGWRRAASDLDGMSYYRQRAQEMPGLVIIEKNPRGALQVVFEEGNKVIEAFNPEDATDVVVQLLRLKSKGSKSLHLELVGFEPAEGSAFVRSCEIRSASSDVPSEISAFMRNRNLSSSDVADISSARYNYSKAKVRVSETTPSAGQQVTSISIDIPEIGSSRMARTTKIDIAFNESTPKAVIKTIMQRIVDAITDVLRKMGDRFDSIRFNLEMNLAIKRIANETGVDFKVIRHQFESEKGDLYFAETDADATSTSKKRACHAA